MKKILLVFLITLNIAFASNRCENKLFSFQNSASSNISISSILQTLAVQKCGLNIVYTDSLAQKRLKKLKLGDISVKNWTLNQFLNLLLSGNNLFYKIVGNELRISYVKTETFNVDYIPSTRTGTSSFTASSSGQAGDTNTVDSSYDFNFWGGLAANLEQILNTVDSYKAPLPIIDKNAGLVTITATKRQLTRIAQYINKLNQRLHKQIIIDVRIYSVDLSKSYQTGINWSNLNFALGNANAPLSTTARARNILGSSSIISNTVFNISGLLNFLSTEGNVNSISNPKIVTLNNQKAIISVGSTINYRYPSKVVVDANGNPQTEYTVASQFVGILLDITPEISNDGSIILRINPTISAFRDETQLTDPNRDLAPDTTDDKMSTVVRIKDGQTLILGGLITNKNSFTRNGVPILKEIPIIKYLFSYKSEISSRRELVFIVTPHIVDSTKKKTLQDLGF